MSWSRKRVLRRLRKRSFWINPASLMLGALVTVLVLYVSNLHILELIELKTYDLRFVSRGPLKPAPAVAMAVIDDKTLDVEGRWPWPCSKFAKVIGFDVIFPEPDQNSQLALIDEFAGTTSRRQAIRAYTAGGRRPLPTAGPSVCLALSRPTARTGCA
jgi:adenylate cyclase